MQSALPHCKQSAFRAFGNCSLSTERYSIEFVKVEKDSSGFMFAEGWTLVICDEF